jgi:hypothetical protein
MVHVHPQIDLSKYQSTDNDFAHRSLKDLIQARDLFHVQLMRHPNVVATALGRYRIRKGDSWPQDKKKTHGTGPRRLDNSEVRPYSWPAILVFVSKWEDAKTTDPGDMVPRTVFMPDGSRVPICVIEAPRVSATPVGVRQVNQPLNNLGPGSAVIAHVQGQDYLATIGCLVSDGHKIYALTNRHVTGEAGEIVEAVLGGERQRIGESAAKQLTRMRFSDVYPNFSVQDTFVNLDIGLVEVDDIARWTTKVRELGVFGPMADFSGVNLSLSLVGCHVCGVGAASGKMLGEVQGLFYRYKTGGGFEYVADIFIGPRTPSSDDLKKAATPRFATHPGDSGTLWLLEPEKPPKADQATNDASGYVPLALQWGRNMLDSAGKAPPQSYALATLLSRACALLDVDPVRDWNIDQTDTWGALGHFSIAARTLVSLTNFPKLNDLMEKNLAIISHDDATLEEGDFTGMGGADFVPMADVPDFFWKPRVGKQGFTRALEGGNHFADMDQEGADGKTLLEMTTDDRNIDPDVWETYYNGIADILSGKPVREERRGLLPFRVWEVFNAMCEFVRNGETEKFVCAAGVLTHYVGDACQPLHISYLHDGDPKRPVEHTFSKGKKAGTTEERPMGQGVHSAYEDAMVFAHRKEILKGLEKTPKAKKSEYVANGFEAAKQTIALMRRTFGLLPPEEMVQTYIDVGKGGKAASDALWSAYGARTIQVMQDGTHLLAVLWESAWKIGDGDANIKRKSALSQDEAMEIVKDPDFLPSTSIGKIGAILTEGTGPRIDS